MCEAVQSNLQDNRVDAARGIGNANISDVSEGTKLGACGSGNATSKKDNGVVGVANADVAVVVANDAVAVAAAVSCRLMLFAAVCLIWVLAVASAYCAGDDCCYCC